MKSVTIVVGHCPDAPGAMNQTFNVTEYEFNNELAQLVATQVRAMGIKPTVVYRDTLKGLPKHINQIGSDIVVSLHCNAFNKIVSGSEVLHYEGSGKGEKLASCIHSQVVETLGLRDRGLQSNTSKYLLKKTDKPCVILEPFFIDNDVDYLTASEQKTELAIAIAMGIKDYFE